MGDRKALIRQYKESRRPSGIFCVRNTVAGTLLVGSTPNLQGMLNRQRFQLETGGHPDRDLQADWDTLGPHAFEFEVLDTIEAPDESGHDLSDDLAVLKSLWLDRLTDAGTPLYRQSRRGERRNR